ncbi:protein-tyrosine-phosphatase [Ensifer sp.]|uniref:tyrosine phosphatase family protein n=1 Tax=Ensifer sp. TaxID=1872086 RepID=UPI002E15CF07|nr:protein-tyrosine-phosphatase [Ensifer sp.]
MELSFSPVLTVCGIDELPDQSGRNVTHVLSIVDPELPELDAFGSYGEHHRTTLRFHDIIADAPNRVMPRSEHVETILRFGTDFLAHKAERSSSHLLVHCHMGVSRSTAAMLTLMAQANPDEPGESLFARLTAIRPQAWPNSQMIGFADAQLDRRGDLTSALARHYGRQIRARPEFTEWMKTLGREAELHMAVQD